MNKEKFTPYIRVPSFTICEQNLKIPYKSYEVQKRNQRNLRVLKKSALEGLIRDESTQSLDMNDLVASFKVVAKNYNFTAKKELTEKIKTALDVTFLRDGTQNTEVSELLKENYESNSYSQKTSNLIVDGIDPRNLGIIAEILKEGRLAPDSKMKLFDAVGNDEQTLKTLFRLTRGKMDVALEIVKRAERNEFKIAILTNILGRINNRVSEQERQEQMKNNFLSSMQYHIAEELALKCESPELLTLIDSGALSMCHVMRAVPSIASSTLLYDIAKRCDNASDIIRILKCITDQAVLKNCTAASECEFVRLDECGRTKIIAIAEKCMNALSRNTIITQVGKLRDTNKFITGIPRGEDAIHIAWSNTGDRGYHRDIFATLEAKTGLDFPEELRSGGYIKKNELESGELEVVFYDSSGDFGQYSKNVLERYRDELSATLGTLLGRKVMLTINNS
ncbi:MAG: hypothetical protein AAB400_03995 [Patescibacteria group bacterium]